MGSEVRDWPPKNIWPPAKNYYEAEGLRNELLGFNMDSAFRRIEDLKFDGILDPDVKDPEELRLRGIRAVKIYYCFYGRNAWHSTWVQKYYIDCMHSNLDSAKRFAERNRVQGSVFYIEELPALLLDGGSYPVLVTQINERCPLREYSAKALREDVSIESEKIEGYRNNYLTFGSPLNGVILSFEYNSRFWKTQQPWKNSVILLYTETEFEPVELKTTKLKAWKSSSLGKDYYLSWSPIKSRVSQSSVIRLFNQSGFNKKKPNNGLQGTSSLSRRRP